MTAGGRRGRADLSALVVDFNTTRLALQMLESLAAQRPKDRSGRPLDVEFVLVDNAGFLRDDEAWRGLERFAAEAMPGVLVRNERNEGYAGGMNRALEHAGGRRVLVLNPDLVFLEGAVQALWDALDALPDAGAVGPAGYWDRGREVRLPPNILPTLGDLVRGTLAHVFSGWNRRYMDRRLSEALPIYAAERPIAVPMLSGACLMLDRGRVEAAGGLFDPNFPLYYEDTDLFRRLAAAGYRLYLVPEAGIAHFYNRSGTTAPEEARRRYWRARAYYYAKWYGPVGAVLDAAARAFLRTRLAARARTRMEARVLDLGDVSEPPVLRLPRSCRRFVLEMCQDAAFLLAAAIFGEGDSWRPGDSFWEAFGESEYFFRAVDLSGERPEELAVFRFRRVGSGPPARGERGGSRALPAQNPAKASA